MVFYMSDSISDVLMLSITLCITHVAGNLSITMSETGGSIHSIGSNATVMSEIKNGSRLVDVVLYAKNSTHNNIVGYTLYIWKEVEGHQRVSTYGFKHLSFSSEYDPDLTRRITWNFAFLPEEYDQLNLTMEVMHLQKHTVLHVAACQAPQNMSTTGQNSMFKITSNSLGHFNDEANCSCEEEGQILFNIDGSKNKGTAKCGPHAEWIGCENVQCWSGPKHIYISQLHYTVNSSDSFDCNFVDGFPVSKSVHYKLNNATILPGYTLKSIDNGKAISCEVITNFTIAIGDIFESPHKRVIVYYPPENSSISERSLTIELSSSTHLNFSFSVNLKDSSNITLTLAKDDPGSSKLLSWEKTYTEDMLHIYEFHVNITSEQDYGFYQVCVETGSPVGKSCEVFMVTPMRGLSTLIVCLITGGVYLLIVTAVGMGLTSVLRMKKIGNDQGISTPDAPNTEYWECHDFDPFPRNEVPVEETSMEPSPVYETIDPDSGYEVIELRPAPELVDSRDSYEMVDIIDNRAGYDDVRLPSNYDDIVL